MGNVLRQRIRIDWVCIVWAVGHEGESTCATKLGRELFYRIVTLCVRCVPKSLIRPTHNLYDSGWRNVFRKGNKFGDNRIETAGSSGLRPAPEQIQYQHVSASNTVFQIFIGNARDLFRGPVYTGTAAESISDSDTG